jgi:hypothetical protein
MSYSPPGWLLDPANLGPRSGGSTALLRAAELFYNDHTTVKTGIKVFAVVINCISSQLALVVINLFV